MEAPRESSPRPFSFWWLPPTLGVPWLVGASFSYLSPSSRGAPLCVLASSYIDTND